MIPRDSLQLGIYQNSNLSSHPWISIDQTLPYGIKYPHDTTSAPSHITCCATTRSFHRTLHVTQLRSIGITFRVNMRFRFIYHD